VIMVTDSAKNLKQWLQKSSLNDFARLMMMRIVLAFICHRGRMSFSQAGVAIVPESIHSWASHSVPCQASLAVTRL
jgi:hypothetical protein